MNSFGVGIWLPDIQFRVITHCNIRTSKFTAATHQVTNKDQHCLHSVIIGEPVLQRDKAVSHKYSDVTCYVVWSLYGYMFGYGTADTWFFY